MEYVTLNNGIKMPKLGYGVYQPPPEETERCVREAIEIGCRIIATAQWRKPIFYHTIISCCENDILPCRCRQWGGFHKGRKNESPRAAALGQIIFLQWEFRGKALEPESISLPGKRSPSPTHPAVHCQNGPSHRFRRAFRTFCSRWHSSRIR